MSDPVDLTGDGSFPEPPTGQPVKPEKTWRTERGDLAMRLGSEVWIRPSSSDQRAEPGTSMSGPPPGVSCSKCVALADPKRRDERCGDCPRTRIEREQSTSRFQAELEDPASRHGKRKLRSFIY